MTWKEPRSTAWRVAWAFWWLAGAAQAAHPGEAERLFERGLERMKAGALEEGCELLAQSHALDPLPGALFTLAECRARAGQKLAAWRAFERFVAEVGELSAAEQQAQRARVAAAQGRLVELEGTLARLTVVVRGDADGTLWLNGEERAASEVDGAWVLEPGLHQLRWLRQDGRIEEVEVTLAAGEARTVEVGTAHAGSPGPSQPAPAKHATDRVPIEQGPVGVQTPAPVEATEPVLPELDRGTGTSAWTYTAFGLGAAGVLTGSIAGAVLISRKSTVDRFCTGRVCTEEGYEAARGVDTLDALANVGFAVGGAGIALGLVLLFTADAPRERSSSVGALELEFDVSRVGVRGTW
jgi:hypothetical protein